MIDSHRNNRGFTLIEVLIVVVLMGVLMSAVAAVFSVIVRTAPTTENRVDDAVSLLGLTTWLPPDVNSTPGVEIASTAAHWNTGPSGSGCASGDIGENLVVLNWSEQTGSSPTAYTANYRLENDGAGGSTMWRVSCTDGGAGTVRKLVRDLPSTSTGPVTVTIRDETDDKGVTKIVGLSMTVTTANGDQLRFDAQSNNPNATLDAAPTPATTAATTTTSTTMAPTTTLAPTTTVAPTTSVGETTTTTTATTTPPTTLPPTTTTTTIPCAADFVIGSGSNAPVRKPSVGNGKKQEFGPLDDDVVVTITKSGSCAGLRLEFFREADETGTPVRLAFPNGVRAILEGGVATERWQDGERELRLYDTGNETFLGRIEKVLIE